MKSHKASQIHAHKRMVRVLQKNIGRKAAFLLGKDYEDEERNTPELFTYLQVFSKM